MHVLWNKQLIDSGVRAYKEKLTSILFIKHLIQGGDISSILELIDLSRVFIANRYCRTSSNEEFNTGISKFERSMMDRLRQSMDLVINL